MGNLLGEYFSDSYWYMLKVHFGEAALPPFVERISEQ